MKHELIKTENYLLVVDDSKIKDGDYRVNIQRGYVKLVDDAPEYYNQRNDVFKKVIAHLPLGSPILQGVDLLPPLEQEDDVEKLAHSWSTMQTTRSTDYWRSMVSTYKEGYNKAKEKYKLFTIEKAIQILEEEKHGQGAFSRDEYKARVISKLQSLSQPKMPIGFECATIDEAVRNEGEDINGKKAFRYEPQLKKTTNPKGQTQWVGKYIY